jgi:hypothetical protein
MEYTLVLGIGYKKYKRPATINLFIGGQFLDSFEINEDRSVAKDPLKHLDKTWYDQNGKLILLDVNRKNSEWSFIPDYYRIYQLTEATLNGQLEIQVKNDSNDYTNGFMKNTALIKFPLVGLIPSKLLVKGNQTLMRIISRANKKIKHTYYYKRQAWPIIDEMYIKTDKKSRVVGSANRQSWIGGNFTAVIDIKTKHKVKYLHTPNRRSSGIGIHTTEFSQLLATLKPLINTYNEDQRSYNT